MRTSALVATAGWIVVGGCWLVALFLPWTARGLLSSASLLDAIRLIRDGVVDQLVPSGLALLLLLPAAAGVVLLALSGFRGGPVRWGQGIAALVGTVGSIGFAWVLADAQLGRVGPGAWVSLLGVVVAGGTVAVGWYDGRVARSLAQPLDEDYTNV